MECLNRARRAGRGKGVDSIAEIQRRQERVFALTKSLGLLVTLRHQGKIIAGQLVYVCGNEATLIVIAHDRAYEHFRLGTVVLWKSIEQLIERGISRVNFSWGRHDYKIQFLAVEYPWSIHIVSHNLWLAILWKKWLILDGFFGRVWRFARTRLFKG